MIINNLIAYAIKNENGQYWNQEYQIFSPNLYMAAFSMVKSCAKEMIRENKLKNCKIIKVRIDEVEE